MATASNKKEAKIICTICEEVPLDALKQSPWKCHLGHYMCIGCFRKFVFPDHPTCIVCFSDMFIQDILSSEELEELVYHKKIEKSIQIRCLSMKQLFALPSEIIAKLIKKKDRYYIPEPSKKLTGAEEGNLNKMICPHSRCNKEIITTSVRFHYEIEHIHSDIKWFNNFRGQDAILQIDLSMWYQGETKCLGIINFHQRTEGTIIQHGHFWVMVSDVSSKSFDNSYILVWLFTNNMEQYKCRLELIQESTGYTIGTLCSVNELRETQDLQDISQKMACLHITYGTFKGLIEEETKSLRLHVTIA